MLIVCKENLEIRIASGPRWSATYLYLVPCFFSRIFSSFLLPADLEEDFSLVLGYERKRLGRCTTKIYVSLVKVSSLFTNLPPKPTFIYFLKWPSNSHFIFIFLRIKSACFYSIAKESDIRTSIEFKVLWKQPCLLSYTTNIYSSRFSHHLVLQSRFI